MKIIEKIKEIWENSKKVREERSMQNKILKIGGPLQEEIMKRKNLNI